MSGLTRRVLVAAFIALFALAALAGCGGGEVAEVPETSPEPVEGRNDATGEKIEVYFIREEAASPVYREMKGGAEAALEELLEGPDEEEKNQGYVTAIPAGTSLLDYGVQDGVATADFSKEIASFGGGSALVQAITGQITETVLANDPSVTGVRITVEGVPAEEALQP